MQLHQSLIQKGSYMINSEQEFEDYKDRASEVIEECISFFESRGTVDDIPSNEDNKVLATLIAILTESNPLLRIGAVIGAPDLATLVQGCYFIGFKRGYDTHSLEVLLESNNDNS